MADEILYAGGRLDSVEIAGTVTEITTTGHFDSSYCDAAISCANSTAIWTARMRDSSFALTTVVSGETGYFHCEARFGGNATTAANLFWIEDSSGFPWVAFRSTTSSGVYGFYYNSGTGASPTWTLIGSTFALAQNTKFRLDIKVTLGSPHSAEFSVDNSLTASGTFTQASFTNVRSMRGAGLFANSFSQLMATRGISTINGNVKYSRATGAGSNSGWTGAATNVNEAINSDATVDSTTTAGVKQTYAMGDVTVASGFAIKAVFQWLRAKNDGTAPNNIKSVIRSGGTDYSSSNLGSLGTSFGPVGMRYDSDPATSVAWTASGWNAAEAGYESAT